MKTRICVLAALLALAHLFVVIAVSAEDAAPSMPAARSSVPSVKQALDEGVVLERRSVQQALVIDLGALSTEEKAATTSEPAAQRLPIGVHRALPAEFSKELAPQLTWTQSAEGDRIAAIVVRSPGAVSVRVSVLAVLPAGATVRVFDGNGSARGRAYIPADFSADVVWLPSAEGDTLTVQIAVPWAERTDTLSFALASVAHRYATVVPKNNPLDCSGHQDLACTSDEMLHLLADATARIVFEKSRRTYACTGTLLNVDDGPDRWEPYFLTAHHCVSTSTVASTVEATWFWQNTRCGGWRPDPRSVSTSGGATVLAKSALQDSTLLKLNEPPPSGVVYAGWHAREVSIGDAVHSVHHPAGHVTQYALGRIHDIETAISFDFSVRDALIVDMHRGLTEGGSSGSGIFDGGRLLGVLTGGPRGCGGQGNIYGPLRGFYPHVAQWLNPAPVFHVHRLPWLTPASNRQQRGVLRLVNLSGEAGKVHIGAVDDTGKSFPSFSLSLKAGQTRDVTSQALEKAIGKGQGHWRLDLITELNLKALAFLRYWDGHLMSTVHDVVPETEGEYRVYVFYPDKFKNKSSLRLINPAESPRAITIRAITQAGRVLNGSVQLTMAPGTGRMVSAQALERGASDLTGSLGVAEASRRLIIAADGPLWVMNLMQSPSGRMSNLSTVAQPLPVTDEPEPKHSAPENAKSFYELVLGREFVLSFSSGPANGQSASVRFTSWRRYFNGGDMRVSGTFGHETGDWEYSRQGEHQGLVELDFGFGFSDDVVKEECYLELAFTHANQGRMLSSCDESTTEAALGGQGTFEIRDLFRATVSQ